MVLYLFRKSWKIPEWSLFAFNNFLKVFVLNQNIFEFSFWFWFHIDILKGLHIDILKGFSLCKIGCFYSLYKRKMVFIPIFLSILFIFKLRTIFCFILAFIQTKIFRILLIFSWELEETFFTSDYIGLRFSW